MSKSFITGSVAGTVLSLVGLASVSLMTSPVRQSSQPVVAAVPESALETQSASGQQAEMTVASSATEAQVSEGTDQVESLIIDIPAGSEFAKPTSPTETVLPEVDQAPDSGAQSENPLPAVEQPPALAETAAATAPDSSSLAPSDKTISPEVLTTAEPQPVAPDAESPAPVIPQPTDLPVAEPADSAGKVPAHVSGASQEGGARESVEPKAGSPAIDAVPATGSDGPTEPYSTTQSKPPAAEAATAPAADEGAAEQTKPRVITLNPKPQPAPGAAIPDAAVPGTKPAPLAQSVPGVKINRLPQTLPDASTTPEVGAQVDALPPPRVAYAAQWSNPDNKPVLAIVILDRGLASGGLDSGSLDFLPFPATIALDPEREDAAAIAAAHRAAGKEVAILAGVLPEGATESDFEVAYQSYVSLLPETVALMGMPDADFQKSSLAAQHVAALLSADGRGLVTFLQGLNPGRRAAEKAGVAVASVDRLFDGESTDNGSLMRDLDRAAFTAAQKGAYVIALPSTPEAITSLMAWAAGPGAAHVTLAPVSAVMTVQK